VILCCPSSQGPTPSSSLLQVNGASRTEVSAGYLTQMFRAKIIVTSNPSHWEGGKSALLASLVPALPCTVVCCSALLCSELVLRTSNAVMGLYYDLHAERAECALPHITTEIEPVIGPNSRHFLSCLITPHSHITHTDFRLMEAIASGALILVDRMYVPRPYPLIEGVHVVYYGAYHCLLYLFFG
jgi:hypothetical protein